MEKREEIEKLTSFLFRGLKMTWILLLLCLNIELLEEGEGCARKSPVANGDVTIRGCTFDSKWTTGKVGDTKWEQQYTFTIDQCLFVRCTSEGSRGSICRVVNGLVKVSFSEFRECAGNGPSCFSIESGAEFTDSIFVNNSAKGAYDQSAFQGTYYYEWASGYGCIASLDYRASGGNIGNCTLRNCTFEANTNGGVTSAHEALLVLDACSFHDNTVVKPDGTELKTGGDLLFDGGQITVSNCIFHNDGDNEGRSVYCLGTETVYTTSGNDPVTTTFDNKLHITFDNCTFQTMATGGSTIHFLTTCSESSIVVSECLFCGNGCHFSGPSDGVGASTVSCEHVAFTSSQEQAIGAVTVEGNTILYDLKECSWPIPESPSDDTGGDVREESPDDETDHDDSQQGPGTKKGLKGGEIAAIVIVILVVFVVLIVLLLIFLRKRRYEGSNADSHEEGTETTTTTEMTAAEVVAQTYKENVGIWDQDDEQ